MTDNATKTRKRKKNVIVLFNQVGEDWYERLKQVDPASLQFKPEYPIHVPTVSEEYTEIVTALRSKGYRARAVNLENDLRKLERIVKRSRPDVIFNLVEFFHEDAELEASIAGMFDLYRIPYTGAAPFALLLCQDKTLTKQILRANGVPTPRFKVFDEPKIPKRLGIEFPLMVKPAWEDASAGVDRHAVVHDRDQLLARITHVHDEFECPALVEEFIDGRELHVSVVGNDHPEVLPPLEFDFSDLPEGYPHIVSYAAKWNPLAEVYHRIHTICPASLSKRELRKIEKVALRAYEATWCRDYARLDIRLRRDKPYVLEVNPNPDLTEGVSFMDSADQAGYSFPAALAKIVELALERTPPPPRPVKSEAIHPLEAAPAGGDDPGAGYDSPEPRVGDPARIEDSESRPGSPIHTQQDDPPGPQTARTERDAGRAGQH